MPIALYALGVIALGLIDDTLGHEDTTHGCCPGQARLARARRARSLRGELSTGALKAAGSLGLALLAMSDLGLSNGRWLLAAGVLVLATNVFNLLDLRPGRSTKAFAAARRGPRDRLGRAAAAVGARPVRRPALVAGVYDLRERAMLGDTGANLLGRSGGPVAGPDAVGDRPADRAGAARRDHRLRRAALDLRAVERTPGLRELDSWGRPS